MCFKHIHSLNPSHMTQSAPKTRVARDRILKWITEGRFNAGDRLPPERELAQQLAMNHRTVRRGLAELVEHGVITKKPRVGNFVSEIRPRELAVEAAVVLPQYLYEDRAQQPVASHVLGSVNRLIDHGRFNVSQFSYRPGRFMIDVGQLVLTRRVQAVLLWPDRTVEAEHLEHLAKQGVKLVILHNHSQRLASAGLPSVWADRRPVLRRLLAELAERGHRDIRLGLYTHDPQRQAFLKEVENHTSGFSANGDPVFDIPNRTSPADYLTGIHHALTQRPLPTAIVVPDEAAVGVLLRQCYAMDIRVPQDLSIAAIDNNAPDIYPVELTSGDSMATIGETVRQATQLLEAAIDGKAVEALDVRVETEVHWGQSVAVPRPLEARPAAQLETAT